MLVSNQLGDPLQILSLSFEDTYAVATGLPKFCATSGADCQVPNTCASDLSMPELSYKQYEVEGDTSEYWTAAAAKPVMRVPDGKLGMPHD